VANVSIETISARDMHWFRHILGLRYETTPAQLRYVLDGIRARLAASSAVDSGSIRVRLFRFGHSSLDIEIFAYVLTHDWLHFMEIQERLLVAIMEIVEASGTTIALPSQTLHIADGEIRRLAPTAATREPDSGVAVARRLERPSANA
jgi:MscS family membrane protein